MAIGGHIYKIVAVSGLTLLLGIGIGTIGEAQANPPQIVVKTVDVPGPAVLPQSCKDALNAADAFRLAQLVEADHFVQIITDDLTVIIDVKKAYGVSDWAGMAVTLNSFRSVKLPPNLDAAAFDSAANLCRLSATTH
jgi:hypothetical protein